MESYSNFNLDIFKLKGLKRVELPYIIAVMYFLYGKKEKSKENSPDVSFRYSEMEAFNPIIVSRTLKKMEKIGFIKIKKKPNKYEKAIVTLAPDSVLKKILNTDTLDIEKYLSKKVTVEDLKNFLGCINLYDHFPKYEVKTWLRNINKGTWKKEEFMIILNGVYHYEATTRVKTGTVSKWNGRKNLYTSMSEIYKAIPLNKKEWVHQQMQNSLKKLGKDHCGRYPDLAVNYVNALKKLV